jgi:hypothetical protein
MTPERATTRCPKELWTAAPSCVTLTEKDVWSILRFLRRLLRFRGCCGLSGLAMARTARACLAIPCEGCGVCQSGELPLSQAQVCEGADMVLMPQISSCELLP